MFIKSVEALNHCKKYEYETLTPKEVVYIMNKTIKDFGEILGILPPYEEAKLLLEYYEWNFDGAANEYYINQKKINTEFIFFKKKSQKIECSICLVDFKSEKIKVLRCRHSICKDCWIYYISQNSKNKDCFRINCPYLNCNIVITNLCLIHLDLPRKNILILEERQKIFRFKNFIYFNCHFNRCLGKNCKKVQKFYINQGTLRDITCSCGYTYCFYCKFPGHHPCNCNIARKWIEKETSEVENLQWIIAKTKKCPKCYISIEKNQGCNHIICWNCKFEFCWLCKSNWKNHGSSTGGFYKCNIFEKKIKNNLSKNQEQEDAKSELERYGFYFKRYNNHIIAISQIIKTCKLIETSFIKDITNTIIDCRHLLAWTYPIAYFMEENYPLKNLFHQYQKDLEKYTEQLHELSEKPFKNIEKNKKQAKIMNYQRVIKRYRINLIRIIEKEINLTCNFCRY